MNLQNRNKAELTEFIQKYSTVPETALLMEADHVRQEHFGNGVFVRGLIEVSSYCVNDCLYCGLRRSNGKAVRYRLSREDIIACCVQGHALGFRTFVLQGGEDPAFTDAMLVPLVEEIKNRWPDSRITLSLGERSRDSYQALFSAGANRYLLRHEAASHLQYARLHPKTMTLDRRKRCLWDLKEIGYQVGAGFMVGSPGQKPEDLADDLLFLQELQPHMVGVGPFLSHKDTPFHTQPSGTLSQTLLMLAMTRILLPKSLLPATTALGSLGEGGREQGLRCGANVVMPNLSPWNVRSAYSLYDGKRSFGSEAAEGLAMLEQQLIPLGFWLDMSSGDHMDFQ